MGLFKNLADKAKEGLDKTKSNGPGFLKSSMDAARQHVDKIKSNVNKQDILDLASDVQKDMAKDDELSKMKAAGKLLKGLGQIAAGSYKGASRRLDDIEKDPYDIEMAEETTRKLNWALAHKLNGRRFLYGDPDSINKAVYVLVAGLPFENLFKVPTERLLELLEGQNVRVNQEALESEFDKFKRDNDVLTLMGTRSQVDKYIFIDRLSMDEILEIPLNTIADKEESSLFRSTNSEDVYSRIDYSEGPSVKVTPPRRERKPAPEVRPQQPVDTARQEEVPVKPRPQKTVYYCEYCGQEFGSVDYLTSAACPHHPRGFGHKHKLYEGSVKEIYTCKYCGYQQKNFKYLVMAKCPKHPAGGFHSPML